VFDGVETYKFTEEGRFFQPFVDFKKGVLKYENLLDSLNKES